MKLRGSVAPACEITATAPGARRASALSCSHGPQPGYRRVCVGYGAPVSVWPALPTPGELARLAHPGTVPFTPVNPLAAARTTEANVQEDGGAPRRPGRAALPARSPATVGRGQARQRQADRDGAEHHVARAATCSRSPPARRRSPRPKPGGRAWAAGATRWTTGDPDHPAPPPRPQRPAVTIRIG